MAGNARFTIADVCVLLDVQKHDVRAWLAQPPFSSAPVKARSARKFSQTDLVFFALIAQLHLDLGLSPRSVGRASAALHSLVEARLEPHRSVFINVRRGTAAYLSESVQPSESGIVLAIAPAVERVQSFLLGALSSVSDASQRNVVRLDRRTRA